MKHIFFLFLLIASVCTAQVHDYNIRIDSPKDPDSVYALLTGNTGAFAGRGRFTSLPILAGLIEPFITFPAETQGIDDVLSQAQALTTERSMSVAGNRFKITDGIGDKLIINGTTGESQFGNIGGAGSLTFNTYAYLSNEFADMVFGINKSIPTEALDVTGNGLFSGTLSASNLIGTNTGDQTITNSSDATSHTVTLSSSGGSVQLIEGSGVTLTTGGSGSAGTVTIAASGGASYLVYVANIDFAGGSSDPTPVVFENTLGGSIVWTWEGTGEFLGTLAGMFPDEAKVWIMTYPGSNDENRNVSVYTDSSDEIIFEVVDLLGVPQNPTASSLYHIEIRVYP